MDLILSMHPMARAWLLDGPLSSYVGAFQALLERGRYAEGSSETARKRSIDHALALGCPLRQ